MKFPICPGTLCPIKDTCARYSEIIDIKHDINFSSAPYDHRKRSCEFYIVSNKSIQEQYPKTDFKNGHAKGDI